MNYLGYRWFGLVYGTEGHFQQYLSYMVAVRFIGGGNQSTRRKPPTCRKSRQTVSHYVISSTPHHKQGFNSQLNGKIVETEIKLIPLTNITTHWLRKYIYYEHWLG